MSKLSIPTIVAALSGTLFLSACPGDDTTATGTETEGESTSTGTPPPTTLPPTTTPPDDTTTTTVDPDTTIGVDDTSSSGTPPDTTTTTGDDTTGTTGDDTTGTTSGSSSGESSSGESTESTTGDPPPPPAMGYGDCANFEEAVACLADEICISGGDVAVCAEQNCVDAADCIVPPTGNAVVTCANITQPDMDNDCYLDCSMGETCPDDMVCSVAFGVCIWELLPPPPPPPGICPDEDLGNAVPQSVMGDNTGLGDDWEPSCAPGGEDSTYQFTAPAAGSYTFDTIGSMGDTVLAVLDDCAGPELGCNDDIGMGTLQSEVTLPLAANQTVIIVVEGFGGGTGPFTLNISQ